MTALPSDRRRVAYRVLRDKVEVTAPLADCLQAVGFPRGVMEPARVGVSVASVEGAGDRDSDYKNISSYKVIQ